MGAGKSSRVHRQYKTKYRIWNWREYKGGLRSRGDVTIWRSEGGTDRCAAASVGIAQVAAAPKKTIPISPRKALSQYERTPLFWGLFRENSQQT